MTLECSGNGSSPGFSGAVYNSRWTGTPLAPLLKECGIKPERIEVVFFGARSARKRRSGQGTPRELTVEVPFGRSMSLEDAHAARSAFGLRAKRPAAGATQRRAAAADRPRLVRHRQREVADADRSSRSPLHGPLHGPRLCDRARRAARATKSCSSKAPSRG